MGSPESWRMPGVGAGVDPLPPVGAHPEWRQLVMDYFCGSPFLDPQSLTAMLRAQRADRATAEKVLAERTGVHYKVVSDAPGVHVVAKLANEKDEHTGAMRELVEEFYYITHGTIRKAPLVKDLCARRLSRVVAKMHDVLETVVNDFTSAVDSQATTFVEPSETPENKGRGVRVRTHNAESYVNSWLNEMDELDRLAAASEAAAQAAQEAKQHRLQQKRQREEAAAAQKRKDDDDGEWFKATPQEVEKAPAEAASAVELLEPVRFKDVQGAEVCFELVDGQLRYSMNGSRRPAFNRVIWQAKKTRLLFPEMNRCIALPPNNLSELLGGIARLATKAKVRHNIQPP
eukprot:Sspe_Gene.116068::Locus_104439_Transcript_1_1_Confidence_1.000_Length_1738::g.116068::m.116068